LKFGMQIDLHVLNEYSQTRTRRLSRFSALWPSSLKAMLRHNSAVDRPLTTKFDKQIQNDTPMTKIRSKSKPEVEFQYGTVRYSKPDVISQPWIDMSDQILSANRFPLS